MTATFVERVQLQDDKVEMWIQPAFGDIEIGMRFKQGATNVSLELAPGEAIVLAHRLLKMAKQVHANVVIGTPEEFPDF